MTKRKKYLGHSFTRYLFEKNLREVERMHARKRLFRRVALLVFLYVAWTWLIDLAR
jgi:hypothetical protein